jgi:hypothetical protein
MQTCPSLNIAGISVCFETMRYAPPTSNISLATVADAFPPVSTGNVYFAKRQFLHAKHSYLRALACVDDPLPGGPFDPGDLKQRTLPRIESCGCAIVNAPDPFQKPETPLTQTSRKLSTDRSQAGSVEGIERRAGSNPKEKVISALPGPNTTESSRGAKAAEGTRTFEKENGNDPASEEPPLTGAPFHLLAIHALNARLSLWLNLAACELKAAGCALPLPSSGAESPQSPLQPWLNAREYCTRAAWLDERNAKTFLSRALALEKLMNFEQAFADLERARRLLVLQTLRPPCLYGHESTQDIMEGQVGPLTAAHFTAALGRGKNCDNAQRMSTHLAVLKAQRRLLPLLRIRKDPGRNITSPGAGPDVCDECLTRPCDWFCLNCSVALCVECDVSLVHVAKKLRAHTRLPLPIVVASNCGKVMKVPEGHS